MFKNSILCQRRRQSQVAVDRFLDDNSLSKKCNEHQYNARKKAAIYLQQMHSSNGLRNGEKRKNERRIGLDRTLVYCDLVPPLVVKDEEEEEEREEGEGEAEGTIKIVYIFALRLLLLSTCITSKLLIF